MMKMKVRELQLESVTKAVEMGALMAGLNVVFEDWSYGWFLIVWLVILWLTRCDQYYLWLLAERAGDDAEQSANCAASPEFIAEIQRLKVEQMIGVILLVALLSRDITQAILLVLTE